MTRLSISALIGITIFAACTWTGSYGPYSYWGRNDSGYIDTRLAANQWLVTYRGNSLSDPLKVVDFTLLRAAELTAANGYRYFLILGTADGTRTSAIVAPGTTTAKSTTMATCSST